MIMRALVVSLLLWSTFTLGATTGELGVCLRQAVVQEAVLLGFLRCSTESLTKLFLQRPDLFTLLVSIQFIFIDLALNKSKQSMCIDQYEMYLDSSLTF